MHLLHLKDNEDECFRVLLSDANALFYRYFVDKMETHLTCVIPLSLIYSLKSLAINCGPLSEITRDRVLGYCSLARSIIISISPSFILSRISEVDNIPAVSIQYGT